MTCEITSEHLGPVCVLEHADLRRVDIAQGDRVVDLGAPAPERAGAWLDL